MWRAGSMAKEEGIEVMGFFHSHSDYAPEEVLLPWR